MHSIYILLQFLLSFYIFYNEQAGSVNIFWLVGVIVFHLNLYLGFKLAEKARLKSLLSIGDIIWLCILTRAVSSSFWLLVSAAIIEHISKCRKQDKQYKQYKMLIGVALLMFVILMLISQSVLEEGLLLLLTVVILGVLAYSQEEIKMLKRDNEHLRDKLYKSNCQLMNVQKETSQIEKVAKLEERNFLVQKLHDKIGHILAANIMQLEAVKILLHKDQDSAEQMLAKTVQNLRSGMDDIRETLRNIKPEQSELGISQIRILLDELTREHHIETELSFEGDLSAMSLSIWHTTVKNLGETITNLLKHSKANRLTVKIEIFHKIIKIQFKDNGTPTKSYEKGLGLMGMEERTQAQGGRLIINTFSGFETLMIFEREGI